MKITSLFNILINSIAYIRSNKACSSLKSKDFFYKLNKIVMLVLGHQFHPQPHPQQLLQQQQQHGRQQQQHGRQHMHPQQQERLPFSVMAEVVQFWCFGSEIVPLIKATAAGESGCRCKTSASSLVASKGTNLLKLTLKASIEMVCM